MSMSEANAVITIECKDATSFAGLEYFTNIESFKSSSVKTADFRYNKSLETIDCSKSGIESVDLRYNDKLTSISFSDCELLTDVVALSDSLTSIGESAFYGCSSLTSIDIPDGVTSIGYVVFSGCRSLETVDASQCKNISSIKGYSFNDCPIKEFLLGTSNPSRIIESFHEYEAFDDYMPDSVLKVPAESVEAYKNSDWAKYFETIEAL